MPGSFFVVAAMLLTDEFCCAGGIGVAALPGLGLVSEGLPVCNDQGSLPMTPNDVLLCAEEVIRRG